MFVKPFSYVRAGSIDEACAVLRQHGGDAKVLAGGQSLLPMINLGLAEPGVLVDIAHIDRLEGVRQDNGALVLGALTRHHSLEVSQPIREAAPLLAEAVRHVGNPRVRNRGTIGGSIAHNDPTAELPLVMNVLNAEYQTSNGGRERTVPASEFPVTYFTTRLEEDELLVSVSIPPLQEHAGWGFHELSRRAGDFAIVSAAVVAACPGGTIHWLRMALSGVSERVVRCTAFEEAAQGASPQALSERADAITEGLSPTDDAVEGGYRLRVARVLGIRAVQDACRRSMEAP